MQALQRGLVHTNATRQWLRHGPVHGPRLRSGSLLACVVQSSVQPLLPFLLFSFCAPLSSRLFGCDQGCICLSLDLQFGCFTALWLRSSEYLFILGGSFCVAPSRPFDHESPVSALQSGTRLGSSSRVKSSTLAPHQIFVRTSSGGFLHAELSSNGFSRQTRLPYSGWLVFYLDGTGQTELIFASEFEGLSRVEAAGKSTCDEPQGLNLP